MSNPNAAASRQSTGDVKSPQEAAPKRSLAIVGLVVAVLAGIGAATYFMNQAPVIPATEVDLSKLTVDPAAKEPAAATNFVTVSGKDVTLNGRIGVFSSEIFPVDPNKSYEIKIRMRVMPGADGAGDGAVTFAGVATFDKDGVVQKSAPGEHRYALMRGELIKPSTDWVERTAVITGAGDTSANEFRVGTTHARLVVIANYNGDANQRTEISELSWRELPN